jgi:cytochrome P450
MNGYNATATALTWTLYLLAQHPNIQARTCAELDEGGYARMVVMEALRLYPPAWILARVARCADRLGDTDIAAGDVVSASPYTMQRLAGVWPQPTTFDPDRFTAAATRERPAYAYFPFGGGARRCTAASHMIGQLQLALATLLRRCEVTPEPDTDTTVRPRGLVALHPAPAVRLHFRPRG